MAHIWPKSDPVAQNWLNKAENVLNIACPIRDSLLEPFSPPEIVTRRRQKRQKCQFGDRRLYFFSNLKRSSMCPLVYAIRNYKVFPKLIFIQLKETRCPLVYQISLVFLSYLLCDTEHIRTDPGMVTSQEYFDPSRFFSKVKVISNLGPLAI